jgi:hypothetical protein
MSLEGHIENGQIVIDEPATLPEGTRVRVELLPTDQDSRIPTLFERLKPFIGCLEGLPEDAATEHDHYLSGTPKRV